MLEYVPVVVLHCAVLEYEWCGLVLCCHRVCLFCTCCTAVVIHKAENAYIVYRCILLVIVVVIVGVHLIFSDVHLIIV